MERLTISSDKAWAMLAHVEETFRLGLEMMAEVNEEDVAGLEAALGLTAGQVGADSALDTVTKGEPLGPLLDSEQMMLLKRERVRAYLRAKKHKALAYVSRRFRSLTASGMVPAEGPPP